MKKYSINRLFILHLFLVLHLALFGQSSYEFAQPMSTEDPSLLTVDPSFYGTYDSGSSSLKYEVNAQGIFIHTINIQAMTRETLRETGKYFIRNEHIFGVSKDSIPYVYQDSLYYFGVRNSTKLVGDSVQNVLKSSGSGVYILFFKSDFAYVPTKIEFKNNRMYISYMTYDDGEEEFKKVKEQTGAGSSENNLKTVILHPTAAEWKKLLKKGFWDTAREFVKQY